jgi:hypothetical protein
MTHAEQISRSGGLLAMLVLVHFVVDWIFQTHAEAMAKHNNAAVRARHCAIYSLGFVPILLYLGFEGWKIVAAGLILFWSHFIEDTYWPVVLWAKYIRRPPQMRWRVKLVDGKGRLWNPVGGFLDHVIPSNTQRWDVAISAPHKMTLRRAQRELDRLGFLEFVGEALGKILMIAVDQIVHVCFLVPIVWMTPP